MADESETLKETLIRKIAADLNAKNQSMLIEEAVRFVIEWQNDGKWVWMSD
jgi:hypothetical protein